MPTADERFPVWLAGPKGGTAHRRRDCPRLENRPGHSMSPVSVSAHPLPEFPGLVEVPSIARSRYLHRTVRLCKGCGDADR